jgi:hypothetical protein
LGTRLAYVLWSVKFKKTKREDRNFESTCCEIQTNQSGRIAISGLHDVELGIVLWSLWEGKSIQLLSNFLPHALKKISCWYEQYWQPSLSITCFWSIFLCLLPQSYITFVTHHTSIYKQWKEVFACKWITCMWSPLLLSEWPLSCIPNCFENNIFGQWGRKVQTISYEVVEKVRPWELFFIINPHYLSWVVVSSRSCASYISSKNVVSQEYSSSSNMM